MKFSEVVSQTLAWLQREGRVSYRALRLEFDLNEDVLDAIKEEIIEIKEAAVDRDGKMLVRVDEGINEETDKKINGERAGEKVKGEKGETGKASEVVSSQLSVVSPQPPTPNTQPPAERRQLTVLFCDLVDSTALSPLDSIPKSGGRSCKPTRQWAPTLSSRMRGGLRSIWVMASSSTLAIQ